MSDMERLEQALKDIRAEDAGRGASEFLETRLRAAFREQRAPRPRFRWSWLGALATAAMAAFAVWRLATPAAIQAPTPAPPVLAKKVPPAAEQPVVAKAQPAPKPAPAPRRRATPRPQQPIDAVTASSRENDFIALPYAPPFAPRERGQVMRVRMPRQALRQLGLPMNEERIFERIPADVLLGEDGIPRAIRIVNSR